MFPLLQAVVALALLIVVPFIKEPAQSERELLIDAVCALLLSMIAIRGFIAKLRDRKPLPFMDTVLVDVSPDSQMPSVAPEDAVPPGATKQE